MNEFYEKLAKLAINYAIRVKKGDRIYISGPTLSEPLFQAMYIEILKAGGHPLLIPYIEGFQEILYKFASEEQLSYLDDAVKLIIKEFDGYVEISGDYNTRKLSLVDPEKIAKYRGSPARKELFGTLMKRIEKKDLNYLVIPFPCNSLAQEAKMDLFSYFEFVQKALYLDREDPVKEWQKIEQKQEIICKYLNKVENIQVIGTDTNLTMSVKDRIWINSCGYLNLPDGEVYTGPIEDSVNGNIRFTFPGIYQGNDIENIYLEFKEGNVVKANADKGEDLLKEILKIENANILGEFAIGTNYGITKFTKNMLFDEKMGGTLHCALGLGILETGSKNISAIHWDILKDMKLPGSQILADEKIIYEEGKWKI
ncbi:MAG: aminopeptidase [Promethearchaeota archaeon Loki_b32]|nr:MAG: aminopeptidase [Candidatus Lokiarchaeota archaeon Loki_b32]